MHMLQITLGLANKGAPSHYYQSDYGNLNSFTIGIGSYSTTI